MRAISFEHSSRHHESGGARVLYLYVESTDTIYLIMAYPKNVQGNLTAAQKQQVRNLVARLT